MDPKKKKKEKKESPTNVAEAEYIAQTMPLEDLQELVQNLNKSGVPLSQALGGQARRGEQPPAAKPKEAKAMNKEELLTQLRADFAGNAACAETLTKVEAMLGGFEEEVPEDVAAGMKDMLSSTAEAAEAKAKLSEAESLIEASKKGNSEASKEIESLRQGFEELRRQNEELQLARRKAEIGMRFEKYSDDLTQGCLEYLRSHVEIPEIITPFSFTRKDKDGKPEQVQTSCIELMLSSALSAVPKDLVKRMETVQATTTSEDPLKDDEVAKRLDDIVEIYRGIQTKHNRITDKKTLDEMCANYRKQKADELGYTMPDSGGAN